MEKWEELDNEGEEEEANLTLINSILSDSELEAGSDSKLENINQVLSKYSISNLRALCHDFMERCLQKVRHVKMLTKQHDHLKSKLKLSNEKSEKLEKDKIALA